LGRVPAFEHLCERRGKLKSLPVVSRGTINTWKAMTNNANTQGVPSFWQKWWNALTKYFKRGRVCPCAAEKQSAPDAEQFNPSARKAMA
jgi:hypothetical protein